MAETRLFFSRLVDSSASYVRRGVSMCRRTDQGWQHDAFSWYDQRQQHNATSSGRGWTDQQQRHDASSLGWSMVWLLTCNGKSVCAGGLINGGDTMLFLGMIDGGNMMLLPSAGRWWGEHWPLAWCDRQNSDACRNINVGVHNEYTLASTVIGTIRYYKT
jgi:hypothetical protein